MAAIHAQEEEVMESATEGFYVAIECERGGGRLDEGLSQQYFSSGIDRIEPRVHTLTP
jgi:hypothetical protein